MPELTINLKLRKDSTKELTFEEVDGNFLSLKSAITELNDNLQSYSLTSHTHEGLSPMLGMIAHFALPKAPEGWLVCDGSAVSRTQYSKLFAAMGVIFGVGDGVNTFNLPDLRGEFIRGFDGGRGVDAGRAFGSKQEDAIESHSHKTDGSDGSSTHAIRRGGDGTLDAYSRVALSADADYITGSKTGTYGSSETRPRNVALLPCIKY